MTATRIHSGVEFDYTVDGWSEYKKWLDGSYARLPFAWADEGLWYYLIAFDGPVYRTLSINKTDASDFESNYKKYAAANYQSSRVVNSPLKNGGGSSNIAVNGSSSPYVFSYSPPSNYDVEVDSICLLVETTNSLSFGNKFIDSTISTLANGLLLEAKSDDVSFTWQNCKRTRDIIELTSGGKFDIVTGTPNFFRAQLWLPKNLKLNRAGSWETDDYLRVTVRDNLTAITFAEVFFQGVKL